MHDYNILVPVDFSNCSLNALKYAISIAKRMKAEVSILHAFSVPITPGAFNESAIAHGLVADTDADINQSFKILKHKVPELSEVAYKTITKYAFVTDAILSVCMTNSVDLIVMGTTGATGIKGVIMGTNTYSVIKNVKCPVLAIPENSKSTLIKNIALASDYKSMNKTSFNMLTLLNQLFSAKIHIVHINEEYSLSSGEADEAKKFEHYFKDVQHTYHLIIDEDVENGITEYIREHEIDLLALIPRKHHLFDQIFGGGNSKPIIFHSKIPILALPE